MVAELDDELDCINCTDEDLDCLGGYYRDMTVIFDIDRYCRLHQMLMAAGDDRKRVKVYMDATIRSVSGSFEYALMGCCLEICFTAVLTWKHIGFGRTRTLILMWHWYFRPNFTLPLPRGLNRKSKRRALKDDA